MSDQPSETKDGNWENIVKSIIQANSLKPSPNIVENEAMHPTKLPSNLENIHSTEIKTEMISYLAPFTQQYYLETSLKERSDLKGNVMCATKDFLLYADTLNILKLVSLHNLKTFSELQLHENQIIEITTYNECKTSVSNPLSSLFKEKRLNLFGSIDEEGLMLVWFATLNASNETIQYKILMSTKLVEKSKEVRMKFKTPLVFLTFSNKELSIWSLATNHYEIFEKPLEEQNPSGIPGPSKYLTHLFGNKIKDADFSQKNDLIYVCLDNNSLTILNGEFDVIKSFEPYQESPQDLLIQVFSYMNVFKSQSLSNENKELIPNNFSLKDVFLTISNKLEIKVWDLSELDNKEKNSGCIETIKPRKIEGEEEKVNEFNEKNFIIEFDFTRNFLFVLSRQNEENILCIYHIDKRFYVYNEEFFSKSVRFFDYLKEFKLQARPLYEIQVINLHEEEYKLYFHTEDKVSLTANTINEMQKEDLPIENYEICDSKTYFAVFCLYSDYFNINLIASEAVYPMYLIEDLDKIEKTECEEQKKPDEIVLDENKIIFPPPLPDFLSEMHINSIPHKKSDDAVIKSEPDEKKDQNSKTLKEEDKTNAIKQPEMHFYPQEYIYGNPFLNNKFFPQNNPFQSNPFPQNTFQNNMNTPPNNNNSNHINNNYNYHNANNNINNNNIRGGMNSKAKKPRNSKKEPKKGGRMENSSHPQHKYVVIGNNSQNHNRNESIRSRKSDKDLKSPTLSTENPLIAHEDNKNIDNPNKIIEEKPSDILNNLTMNPIPNENQNEIKNDLTNTIDKKIIQEEDLNNLNIFEKFQNMLDKKFDHLKDDLEKSIDKKFEVFRSSNKMIIEEPNKSEINVPKDFQMQFNKLFSDQFEKSVTPCFEKYLVKIFEQINNTFEKGQRFFMDKLNIEQVKSQNIKESLQDALKIFMQMSNSLAENLNNNVKNNSKMEFFYIDKQTQMNKMIDNINDIMKKEKDIQDKITEIEKNFRNLITNFKDVLGPNMNIKTNSIEEEIEKKMKENELKENELKEKEMPIFNNYYDYMNYINRIYNSPSNQMMQPNTFEQKPQLSPQYQPQPQQSYFNNYPSSIPGYSQMLQNSFNPLISDANKQGYIPYQMVNLPSQPPNNYKFSPEMIAEQQKIQDMNAFVLNNLARLQVPISYPTSGNFSSGNPANQQQQNKPNNTQNTTGSTNFNMNYSNQNQNQSNPMQQIQPQMQQISPQMQQITPQMQPITSQSQNYQDTQKNMNLPSFHLGLMPFFNNNPNNNEMAPGVGGSNNQSNNNNPGVSQTNGSNISKSKPDN